MTNPLEQGGQASLTRWSRRRWLWTGAGFLGAGSIGLATYACGIEPHAVQVVRRSMPIVGLPEALQGKVLAQISDLHIGKRVDPVYLARALQMTSDLSPDILVLTGDIVHGNDGLHLDEAIGLIRSHLSMDRLATIAILGNHDYGAHFRDKRVADRLSGKLREIGFQVLRDEATDVAGMTMAGLDDRWGSNWNASRSASVIRERRPSIVLAHNPDCCDELIWGDYQGWILSGHTHGGQCKPPFLPPPLLPVKNKRYTSGYFELSGGRHLYVNPALGYLHRVRFLVPPEITLFTLESVPTKSAT
ncbi:metallophosphoesterase [bacterium]|nr:metallophosphoesterase [bacterium]